jgi:hypothetical protein
MMRSPKLRDKRRVRVDERRHPDEGRMMQRKPMWQVVVSTDSACRAAGR